MDREGIALMAGLASVMASDAHHSHKRIEQYMEDRLVDFHDQVVEVHARLGSAMKHGNMFAMVHAYEDLSQVLALASIGMPDGR